MCLSASKRLHGDGEGDAQLYALVDRQGTGDVKVQVVASGLVRPTGVAWRNYRLWVAEPGRILRYDDIDAHVLKGEVSKVKLLHIPQANFAYSERLHYLCYLGCFKLTFKDLPAICPAYTNSSCSDEGEPKVQE